MLLFRNGKRVPFEDTHRSYGMQLACYEMKAELAATIKKGGMVAITMPSAAHSPGNGKGCDIAAKRKGRKRK
jgi:hypothetical protein